MNKDFVNALNDVLGFDVSNQKECIDNSCCGVGTLFDTKEEATECYLKANALGDFFGWEKYKVYLYTYRPENKYVCMTDSEYEESNKAFYKPL